MLAIGSGGGFIHLFSLDNFKPLFTLQIISPSSSIKSNGKFRFCSLNFRAIHSDGMASHATVCPVMLDTPARPNCLSYHAQSNLLFCDTNEGQVHAWYLRKPTPPNLPSDTTDDDVKAEEAAPQTHSLDLSENSEAMMMVDVRGIIVDRTCVAPGFAGSELLTFCVISSLTKGTATICRHQDRELDSVLFGRVLAGR